MSGNTITAYVPYQGSGIVGFGLREKNKQNIFGEDVGEIVALNDKGQTASIRMSHLLECLGCDKSFARDSISEKATLLNTLEKYGYKPKLTLLLKSTFSDSTADAAAASAADKAIVHSCFIGPQPKALKRVTSSSMSVALNETRLLNTGSNDLKIAFAFYDKITTLFSYATGGRPGAIDKKTSYFQIVPNGIPIDLEAYSTNPPITPMNPQGDLRTTEEFSNLASMQFDPNGTVGIGNVEKSYDLIIHGADSTQSPDEKAEKIIQKAYNYLYEERTVTDPFTEEKTTTTAPSREYSEYKDARIAYETALTNYLTIKDTYDLSKPEDQRAWQRDSVRLQGDIDRCQEDLKRFQLVERALEVLSTYGNNAVRYLVTTSKTEFDNSKMASQLIQGTNYHISYGYPSSWYQDDKGFSNFQFSTKEQSEQYSHEATSYGGGASFQYGWLSVGGSFQSSTDETRQHLEGSDLSFSFKLGTVPLQRPWMNTTLFALKNWNLGGQPAGKISSGVFPGSDPDINNRILPYYATALVIAKDVKISGNWSQSDLKLLKKSISGTTSVSIGPFRIGGAHYSKSSEKKDFHSTYSDGTFSVPGAQIIGAINVVIPYAAPDNG